MFKNISTLLILLIFATIGAHAEDSIFSNSESEQLNLKPLNIETKTINGASSSTPNKAAVQIKKLDSKFSNQNYVSAINSLDTAQVQLREQLQTYANLMIQSKSSYLSDKDEYRAYKKQYNSIKRKINKIDKSKKLIQANINTAQTSTN